MRNQHEIYKSRQGWSLLYHDKFDDGLSTSAIVVVPALDQIENAQATNHKTFLFVLTCGSVNHQNTFLVKLMSSGQALGGFQNFENLTIFQCWILYILVIPNRDNELWITNHRPCIAHYKNYSNFENLAYRKKCMINKSIGWGEPNSNAFLRLQFQFSW